MKFIKYSLLFLLFSLSSCDFITGEKEDLITIKTSLGEMRFILFDQTPKHKANFIKLAKEGSLNSTLFHRVMKDFMIQGGDPNSKNAKKGARLGGGGVEYKIPAEFVPELFHRKGALSAARETDKVNPEKQSNGSQFFIVKGKTWTEIELKMMRIDFLRIQGYFMNFARKEENAAIKQKYDALQGQSQNRAMMEMIASYKDTLEQIYKIQLAGEEISQAHKEVYMKEGGFPSLDENYTVFGMLVDGFDVLDKISLISVDEFARPVEDISMEVSWESLPKSEITKLYGYKFD